MKTFAVLVPDQPVGKGGGPGAQGAKVDIDQQMTTLAMQMSDASLLSMRTRVGQEGRRVSRFRFDKKLTGNGQKQAMRSLFIVAKEAVQDQFSAQAELSKVRFENELTKALKKSPSRGTARQCLSTAAQRQR